LDEAQSQLKNHDIKKKLRHFVNEIYDPVLVAEEEVEQDQQISNYESVPLEGLKIKNKNNEKTNTRKPKNTIKH
jgi:hypothetical protein